MERVILRLETLGAEVLTRVNEFFRKKVQFEEQLKDIEAELHRHRGMVASLDIVRNEVKVIMESNSFEKVEMKLLSIGAQLLSETDTLFRKKVQKEEELAENTVQLHFYRGYLNGIDRCQKEAKEIQTGEQIEAMHRDNHPKESEEILKVGIPNA